MQCTRDLVDWESGLLTRIIPPLYPAPSQQRGTLRRYGDLLNKEVMLRHDVTSNGLFDATVRIFSDGNVVATATVSLPRRPLKPSETECIITASEWAVMCSCCIPRVYRCACTHVGAVVRHMALEYPGYPVQEDVLYDYRWLSSSIQALYVAMRVCTAGSMGATAFFGSNRIVQPPRFVRVHDTHSTMLNALGTSRSDAYQNSVPDDFHDQFPSARSSSFGAWPTSSGRIRSVGDPEQKRVMKVERDTASASLAATANGRVVPASQSPSTGLEVSGTAAAATRRCKKCSGTGHNSASCDRVARERGIAVHVPGSRDTLTATGVDDAVTVEAVGVLPPTAVATSTAPSIAPSRKGSRKCSKCKSTQHNVRSCPSAKVTVDGKGLW